MAIISYNLRGTCNLMTQNCLLIIFISNKTGSKMSFGNKRMLNYEYNRFNVRCNVI